MTVKRLIAQELMDNDEIIGTPAQWPENLADIARMNALLGGWKALRGELERLPTPPARVVDVATGGADLPRRLLDYLAQRGTKAVCVAVDRSERFLRIAEEMSGGRGDLLFMKADALSLPFADRSFELATCNLALHHFDPFDAIQVLRELARVAVTVIVNDLRRSWIAWAFARFILPLFTPNELTRNDSPISVMRAYTPAELGELARRADWTSISVRKKGGYRMTLMGGVLA
jgi:2-polyprenyl-3-methyl-5-hydroxy-6-metoxy-1,4-benzoquinol methylase